MLVLIEWSVRTRRWAVLTAVSGGWLLIGPAHKYFQTLLLSGYPNLTVLRLMAELGVIGVTAIWVSALVAVRSARSADRSDAAHEDGPNREQHDRAREHDPVTQVG